MALLRQFSFFLLLILILSCESKVKDLSVDSHPFKGITSSIELGERLFFDKALSRDSSVSCASCHLPERAFADNKTKSLGVNDRLSFRNTPSILNVIDAPFFMFDAHIENLEMQAIVPIQDSNEMAMKMGELILRLKKNKDYSIAANKIFNREFDAWVLTRALADFERTLISCNSRFDEYYYKGKASALLEEEIEGWRLFSQKLNCIECHQLPNFTNYKALNNGIYNDYGLDQGRFRIFGDSSDIGKFKVPSLRNVAITYPYMHDGSIGSLEKVIKHYAAGGNGHFNQDTRIKPFNISVSDQKKIILFLNTLTDSIYVNH